MATRHTESANKAALDGGIEGYLRRHEEKSLLKFITCGSVDDGKSTLIGRLLHDTKRVFEDQLAALHKDSKRYGTTGGLDLALLTDGLKAEREQGITIDVAYRYFSTEKRTFIIADTPGHEEYTRNMVTGASTSELAVILVDASAGVKAQTRRHSILTSLLGIRRVLLAVNKMDTVGYDRGIFEAIEKDFRSFMTKLPEAEVQCIPLSALEGQNVVEDLGNTPWYAGPTVLEYLESVEVPAPEFEAGLRFPVQYVLRPHRGFRGYAGTLAAGQIRIGDRVRALPSGRESAVAEVLVSGLPLPPGDAAVPGQALTLTLADDLDLSRGEYLVDPSSNLGSSTNFSADLVWFSAGPLDLERTYEIKAGHAISGARISMVTSILDVNSLESGPGAALQMNQIGRVEVELDRPLILETYAGLGYRGNFIVIDRLSRNTVGAGMIRSLARTGIAHPAELKAVSPEDRAGRLGQDPKILVAPADLGIEAAERAVFRSGYATMALPGVRPDEAGVQKLRLLLAAGLVVVLEPGLGWENSEFEGIRHGRFEEMTQGLKGLQWYL